MAITEKPTIVEGKLPGFTSVILVGVHGNERGGIEAVTAILSTLAIEKGKVIFLYGNPLAIEKNTRFIEIDLNRMFRAESTYTEKEKNSYEYKRAQELKEYFNNADALLDIHSSFVAKSRPFIIAEPNSANITQKLPFNLIVSGFDAIEPGGTDYYMNSIGKPGICIECGYLGDPSSAGIAMETITAFLSTQGHTSPSGTQKDIIQDQCHIDFIYITKSESFKLVRPFEDFEILHKGELIGTDGDLPVIAHKDGIILFARNTIKINDEGYLFGSYKKTTPDKEQSLQS